MDINTGSCEDSMAINLTTGRIAVADGVTNSVHPEIVSSLLCNHFVKGDIILSDWPIVFENKLLPSISEEWKSKEEALFSKLDEFSKDLAEIKRKRKGPGASTFAGIEIDKVNNKVSYLILGDCTLFFIKEDGSYFAINSGQESHEKGDFLNFNNTPNCIVVGGLGQPQRIHGEWLIGSFNIESGYILLMTDGCAEWFQGAYAKDPNVLDNLWNLSDNDDFSKLAEQERTLNGKMDDDLAVIMLKIDTDIFQMEYFPTGQSQAMLIDKTGSVVTDNVDNNNVNLENDDNENNEKKEIEVTTEVKESEEDKELKNEDKKDAEGEESVKENNIDERENNDIENTESINHNDVGIAQESKVVSNTLTDITDSEGKETNGNTTIHDKSTGEKSYYNETIVDVNPKKDDLNETETQYLSEEFLGDANEMTTNARGSNNDRSKTTPKFTKTTPSAELSLKGILPSYRWDLVKCPYCGRSHKENTKCCPETGMPIVFCYYCGMIHKGARMNYCPKTGMPLQTVTRAQEETAPSDKSTKTLSNIICKVCGTQYDTDTCPNCGQPHPCSITNSPSKGIVSAPILGFMSKDKDEKNQDAINSSNENVRETDTIVKEVQQNLTPETSMVLEKATENQTKVNIGNIIQNQEKMVEEGVISDSINDNLENAQIDINASDEDDHLPPSDLREEQIVDVNTNIEAEDDLTKIDSSVPVIQKGSDTNLVEEANSKDETSQTPTEDYLEEIDVDASESLPEASLTGNPVGDNDNSHNINKS